MLFDPDASEERKAGAAALRRSLPIDYRPSEPEYCYRVREEARARAHAFFNDPTI